MPDTTITKDLQITITTNGKFCGRECSYKGVEFQCVVCNLHGERCGHEQLAFEVGKHFCNYLRTEWCLSTFVTKETEPMPGNPQFSPTIMPPKEYTQHCDICHNKVGKDGLWIDNYKTGTHVCKNCQPKTYQHEILEDWMNE